MTNTFILLDVKQKQNLDIKNKDKKVYSDLFSTISVLSLLSDFLGGMACCF